MQHVKCFQQLTVGGNENG